MADETIRINRTRPVVLDRAQVDVMSGGWINVWIVLPRSDFWYHESTLTLNTEDVTVSILKSIYGVFKE